MRFRRVELLKKLCALAAVAMLIVLTAATVVEKYCGTPYVVRHVYGAGWFAVLWGLLASASAAYMMRRRIWKRPAVLLLHAALLVILLGAGVTWAFGRQGTIHLRTGEEGRTIADGDGAAEELPFGVRLDDFRVEYYPGTRAPMDYVSRLTFTLDDAGTAGEVSMNRIFKLRGYRFYQSGYDADGEGTTLRVTYDPWGIGITYAGYALLLAAMAGFFFEPKSRFRKLLRHPAWRRGTLSLLLLLAASSAVSRPASLPRETADELGRLHVCYQDRIAPLSTVARAFTTKLCGKNRYRRYTPEQVAAGWLFYYDDWKREPMIRIRNAEARRVLGIEGDEARLTDFNGAAAERILSGNAGTLGDAGEKFNLVSMLCGGSMLRIFPYADPADGTLHWASPVDDLPRDLPHEQRLFIRRSMNYLTELALRGDYAAMSDVLRKIRTYQVKVCGEALPSAMRFEAERLYGRLDSTLPLALFFLLVGLAGYFHLCRRMVRGLPECRTVSRAMDGALAAGFVFQALLLVLRGYAAGHWPLSNGFETMQFLACCTLGLTLLLRRRLALLRPFGCLIAGLALMVSVMGESNPQITPLMPVLASPLLCIHVMLVMAAYALLAFAMLNGATGTLLCLACRDEEAERLAVVGRLMLYPAVFFLAAGIFVGAVWANVSWGRYWGWDPKETWALITLLVYAAALHGDSLPCFRRPLFFHLFCAAAFLTVLITYFGVNFLLGGMHSYAG